MLAGRVVVQVIMMHDEMAALDRVIMFDAGKALKVHFLVLAAVRGVVSDLVVMVFVFVRHAIYSRLS
jgi:hypothetical protein